MRVNNFKELNGFEFQDFKLKVSKKWIRVYKETESKITLVSRFEKNYDGIRELNFKYDLHLLISGMPIYTFDFDNTTGSLRQLIPISKDILVQRFGTLCINGGIILDNPRSLKIEIFDN